MAIYSAIRTVRGAFAELGVPPGGNEIHWRRGIRAAEQRAIAAQARAVRCLVGRGDSGFPWPMHRLAATTANVWFVVRRAFV